jgi:hypothetical protein
MAARSGGARTSKRRPSVDQTGPAGSRLRPSGPTAIRGPRTDSFRAGHIGMTGGPRAMWTIVTDPGGRPGPSFLV